MRSGVGFDNIDTAGWGACNIPACNVPDYGVHEVAEHAVATYGVHEKDMPPSYVWKLGKRAGFRRKLFLPLPHEAGRAVYRRDFLKIAGADGGGGVVDPSRTPAS